MQIIAMYSRPEIEKVEELSLMYSANLTFYVEDDEDQTRQFKVEAFFANDGIMTHMWDGCTHTPDFAAAMAVYNSMVTIIQNNAQYIQARDPRAEHFVKW